MTELVITRGLPAAGKTTFAHSWVALDPANRARVNRDDLRAMMHRGEWIKGSTEERIIWGRNALITALLKRGVDVISDDTNLPQRTVRDLAGIAIRVGATYDIVDITFTPLEECITRDAQRENPVGERVIRDMYQRYLKGKEFPLPLPNLAEPDLKIFPYQALPGTPKAIIVDIDGTLALKGDRGPFDESRIHEDRPNLPVINAVVAMRRMGHRVVIMSGRTDACRTATVRWLNDHLTVMYYGPYMRKAGDFRKDYDVKAELFDKYVRNSYDVEFVFDDRDQVVKLWRDMGIPCFQVAEGAF